MSLIDRIKSDSIAARKESVGKPAMSFESAKASLLVTLYGEASRVGKDAGNRLSTDDEVTGVIRKFVKNIDETLRLDLSESARSRALAEKKVLEAYLPTELSMEALRAEVARIAAERGTPLTIKDTGTVRASLNEKFPGQINGKVLSDILKEGVAA